MNDEQPIQLEEWHEPVGFVEKDEFETLSQRVSWLESQLEKARRYMPAASERRVKSIRIGYELGGVAVVGTGAWWIYPPLALLLVGGWMLADVIAMRHGKRKG